MTVYQIFFELKFSKFIQNFRTLNVFGKFLLIVNNNAILKLRLLLDHFFWCLEHHHVCTWKKVSRQKTPGKSTDMRIVQPFSLFFRNKPFQRSVNFRMNFWCLQFSKKPTQKFDELLPEQQQSGRMKKLMALFDVR